MQEVCKEYAKSMQEVCKEYAKSMQEVCKEYAKSMQEVYKKYAMSMQRVCKKYARSMQEVCKKYASWELGAGSWELAHGKTGGNRTLAFFLRMVGKLNCAIWYNEHL